MHPRPFVVLGLLVLVLLPVAQAIVVWSVTETSNPPLTAPHGYYFEPATGRWYYYDGVTIQQQSAGFWPPPGQDNVFDVHTKSDASSSGWELTVDQRFIGNHQLNVRVESTFNTPDGAACPTQSSSPPPTCTKLKTLQTTNYLVPVGSVVVLGYITYVASWTVQNPNTGDAEGWAWLDSSSTDKNATYAHGGPATW